MGLFTKNPAEKKLKELTGGMFLNSSFKDKLAKEGLSDADGFIIQRELKSSIKNGEIEVEGVETRLNYLIEQKKAEKSGHNNLTKNKRFKGDNDKSKPLRASSSTDHTRNPRYKGGSSDKFIPGSNPSSTDHTRNPRYVGNNVKSKPLRASSSTDHTRNPRYMGDNKGPSGKKTPKADTVEIEVITADSLENMAKDDKVKEIKFLVNQEHNLKECPKCKAKILQYDKFCFRCGCEVREALFEEAIEKISQKSKSTLESKSTADELSELEQKYEDAKSTTDELSELEKLYNKKVSTKYSPKFKFAYALYLNEINNNPNKSINANYYKANYDTSLVKIKKQAKEDEFVADGSPLIAAKSATVKDLKKILKDHDLMVSGKKEDLIERLGENLTEEELKQLFPKKVLSVTDKGLEFIEKNRHVFYYDKTSQIRTNVEVEEYDSIFDDVDDMSDENIYNLLVDFLLKRENDLVDKKNWGKYRYNFMALGKVYKDMGENLKVLDIDFKLFIAGINNFNDYTNESEPAFGYIGKTYSNELINLLHDLSLSIDDLKDKFGKSYDELKYPNLKISKDESLLYLLKLFSGEDIQDLTEEIHSKYPAPDNYHRIDIGLF